MPTERRDPVDQGKVRDEAEGPTRVPYTVPHLARHGTVEELTGGIPVPGPDVAALGSSPVGG